MISKERFSRIEEIIKEWIKNNNKRIKEIEIFIENYKPKDNIKDFIKNDKKKAKGLKKFDGFKKPVPKSDLVSDFFEPDMEFMGKSTAPTDLKEPKFFGW